MNFKIGDKVKFVNEKGGGTITRFLSSSRVSVAIEDGFEIPYQITDLVNTKSDNSIADFFNRKNTQQTADIAKSISTNINDTAPELKLNTGYLLSKETAGIYFGFVPTNQKLLTSGNIDIFMINHTEAEILFCLFLKDENKNYYSKEYGIIEKESKMLLENIDRKYLDDWSRGYIQILYYNFDNGKIINPVNGEFSFKTAAFSKEESYKTSPYFTDEKGITFCINNYKEQPIVFANEINSKANPSAKIEAMLDNQNRDEEILKNFIKKHIKEDSTAEVDMHIWEISDNYSQFKPDEIFKKQMHYFINCLESALVNKLTKVVFIHGVGNGSLKKEIRIRLEKDYPEITVFDAPIDKYGIGATEIFIPYNMKR